MQRKPLSQGDEDGFCGLYSILNVLELLFPQKMNDDLRGHVFKVLCHALYRSQWPTVVWDGTNWHDLQRMLGKAKWYLNHDKMYFSWESPWISHHLTDWKKFERQLRMYIKGDDAFAIVGTSHPWSHWTCAHRLTAKTMIMTDSCHLLRLPLAKCGLTGDKDKEYLFDPSQTIIFKKTR